MNKKNNKYSHIDEEQRGIIRDKLHSGASANEIAKELGVSHTTITREVKRNHVEKITNIRTANPALYCEKFQTCAMQMELCQNCMSPYTHCKKCVYFNVIHIGNTPLKEAEKIIPKSFFDDFRIEAINPKEVILKPKLLKHTQC